MAKYSTLTSDKNKDTAFILCLLGGFFGLHQFYVGRIKTGIIYLCTGGLFLCGWIIDLISILLGSFRDNVGAPLRATKDQNNQVEEVKIVNSEISQDKEDNITQIERLAKLKEQGIITQEEFDRKKQELLK